MTSQPLVINDCQRRFVQLLRATKAFRVASFVTKSGRLSPYLIDFGRITDGHSLSELGGVFATFGNACAWFGCNVLFGLAYKGIPLVSAVALVSSSQGCSRQVSFSRKEAKTHGEKGEILGYVPGPGDVVLIFDDVITTGDYLVDAVQRLQGYGATVAGAIVGVDRCECASDGKLMATDYVKAVTGVAVHAILTIETLAASLQAADYLSQEELQGIRRYVANHRPAACT